MRLKAVSGIMLTVFMIGTLTLTFNIYGGYVLADGGWNIETVDGAGIVGGYSSIAIDGSDNLHISYCDHLNWDLKYAYYNGSWNIETVDSAGDVGKHTSIALDSGDNPHISYKINAHLKHAYYEAPPSPPSVGGIWIPVDKLALVAPYIALTSTIILATVVAAVFVKRKKKKQ